MKPILLAMLSILLVVAGCRSIQPVTGSSADLATLVTVEYRHDPSTDQTIRTILRSKRFSDWEVRTDGTEKTIKARYKELSVATAAEMEEQLRRLPAVLRIEIIKDGIPVSNAN